MKITQGRRRALSVTALSAAMIMSMAACSSGDSPSTTNPTADASALGSANSATGTTVKVGFISDGKTQVGDATPEFQGAQAAIGYANDYLGGVGGHKLELEMCSSNLVPAGGTDCANQMIKAGVAAVLTGAVTPIDAIIDTLTPAKIPLFMFGATTQKSLGTPGVYAFYNGISAFGVSADQAKEAGVTKAGIIVAAVPQAQGAAEGVGRLVYGNAGVAADVYPVPLGTADMTPQVSTAVQSGAGQFLVLGSDAFCVSAMKSIRTLKPNAPITVPDRCITPGTGSSIPNGYDGISVVTSGAYDSNSTEGKVFLAALAKYGDNGAFGATTGYGWIPTLAMIQDLNAMKVTDLTPANILAGVQGAPALPLPLGAGITYQCNGKANPLSPFICGIDGVVATASTDGTLSDFKKVTLDPSLFKVPTS